MRKKPDLQGMRKKRRRANERKKKKMREKENEEEAKDQKVMKGERQGNEDGMKEETLSLRVGNMERKKQEKRNKERCERKKDEEIRRKKEERGEENDRLPVFFSFLLSLTIVYEVLFSVRQQMIAKESGRKEGGRKRVRGRKEKERNKKRI